MVNLKMPMAKNRLEKEKKTVSQFLSSILAESNEPKLVNKLLIPKKKKVNPISTIGDASNESQMGCPSLTDHIKQEVLIYALSRLLILIEENKPSKLIPIIANKIGLVNKIRNLVKKLFCLKS